LAKRLTQKQKQEIIRLFTSGININDLSKQFDFNKSTITRNLKKSLGELKYQEFMQKSKYIHDEKQEIDKFEKNVSTIKKKINNNKENLKEKKEEEFFKSTEFQEIVPLNCDFENLTQKDLTSVPISEVDFPKIVFMIVDKKVELEIKYLRDYPEWGFLSKDELERKTIEIYFDLKIAKGFCSKEQKVIKVPNTDVFKIVAPILLSKGISRIVSSNQLISL